MTKTNGRINVGKLVLWNLCQPMHKRISATDLQDKVSNASYRGRLAALRSQIAGEVSAKLNAMREQTAALMSWGDDKRD